MTSPRERAERWLLTSGIYVLDKNDPNYGGVYSYYNWNTKSYELVYSEGTGYAISMLKYLHSFSKDEALTELATASGDWLGRVCERNGGVIAMGMQDGRDVREAYAFDNGICCKGLLDLYALTGNRKYLEYAERVADWLVDRALNENGSVKPVLNVESGTFYEDESIWYKVGGSFHSKIGMSLLQLHSINRSGKLRNAAMKMCGWALGQQEPDGSFCANRARKSVNLHFHCYTVEALLYAYASQKSRELLGAVDRAVEWLARAQEADGGFWLWRHESMWKRRKASYVVAQAVRIFLTMHALNRRDELVEAARKAAGFLVSMQVTGGDRRTAGGFFEEGIPRYALAARQGRRVTSWATMFAIHALSLLENRESADFAQAVGGLF